MSRSSTKQKLWRVFAEFVKLRDSKDGYGSCISCGKMVPYPNRTGSFHAGHFYPRSVTFSSLYFDERNVNGQCSHCNYFLEGNKQGYGVGLVKKYGPKILDQLLLKRQTGKKFHEFEMEAMIVHYRGLVKKMKKERGIK